MNLVEHLNDWGGRWALWMGASLFDATVLLAIVSLLWLAVRKWAAPQLGYFLFLLVPLKLFVPIEIAVPERFANWTPAPLRAAALTHLEPAAEPAVERAIVPPLADRQPGKTWDAPLPVNSARAGIEPEHTEEAIQTPVVATMHPDEHDPLPAAAVPGALEHPAVNRNHLSVWGAIMLAWAGVVAALLLRLLQVQVRFHKGLRNAKPLDANQLPVDFEQLCCRVRVRRKVRVVESEAVPSPAVWGVFRPTLILPGGILASLSARQLEWVLLHELAHVRRRDLAVNCFQRLATIVHFHNPAVWIANRIIDRLREYACDDTASALCGGSQIDSGEAFLRVVGFSAQNRQRVRTNLDGALGVFDADRKGASCFQRMRRLLDTDRRLRVRLGLGSLCVLLLTAALALPQIRAGKEPVVDQEAVAATDEPGPSEDSQPEIDDRTVVAPQNAEQQFELLVRGPDGKPVPRAEVELRPWFIVTEQQVRRGEFVKDGRSGTFVRTDSEGRLVLALPESPDQFIIYIQQPGYGPYWAEWSSEKHPEAVPAQFVAELDAAWSVGGVIVDDQGAPVEGAIVSPRPDIKEPPGDTSQLRGGTPQATGADGRWRYDSVPVSQTEVFVEINHPDYMPNRRSLTRSEFGLEPGEQPSASIEMQRGLTVTGHVTDETGTPISGATVRTKLLNDIREAQTDKNGQYRLVGCEPKTARVVVSATGRAREMQDVRISAEMGPVDFRLPPGGRVRVRVLDAAGNPLPKARIFYQGWRGSRFKYFEFDDVNQFADENGVWEWNEAPVDEFKADICPPWGEGMQLPKQPLIARDEEYVFRLPPPLVISGTVVDAQTQKPIESFRVVPGARHAPPDVSWHRPDSFVATNGRYQLKRFRGEPAHLVRIEADGYQVAVSRDIRSDEGAVQVDFELRKAADVAATVLTPAGEPAAGAKVALGIAGSQIKIENGDIDDGSTYAPRCDTDDEGKFRFPSTGDAYQLVITHASGFAYLKSDDGIPDTITLTRWARVEGTFHLGPQTVANVPITMGVHGIHSYGEGVPNIYASYNVTTGSDGEFVFERAFPGDGRIGRRITLHVGEGAAQVTSSKMEVVLLKAGETLDIALGGFGHAATGQLAPPAGYTEKVLWSFALVDVATDAPQVIRQEIRNVTPYFTASVDSEGRFRIDDMPPGDYVLSVHFSEHPAGYLSDYHFSIPEIEDNQPRRVIDLGVLTLESNSLGPARGR